MASPQRFYGAKRDRHDHRDFFKEYQDGEIPDESEDYVDLCQDIVYDQGNLHSCTANAVCAAYELFLRQHGEMEAPSRLFLYYNTRHRTGTTQQDSGSSIRDTLKALNRHGICDESSWPYITEEFKKEPSRSCYENVAEKGTIRYERLRQDISQLRACLRSNSPFVFGLEVYQSFHTKQEQDGEILEPTQEETLEGLHAALAVGYDDQWRAIIVLNSWGAEWGDCGYFYMPYALIEDAKMCFDFWKISFASEGAATSKGAKGSSSSESEKSTSKGAEGNGSSERGKLPNLKTPTPTFKGAKGSGSNERGKSPIPTSKGAEGSGSSERGNPNLKTPTPTSKGAKESSSKDRGKSSTPTSKGAESSKRGNPNLKTPTPTSKGAKGSGSNERGKSTSKSAEGNGSSERGKPPNLKTPTPTFKGAKGSGSNERGKSPIPTSKGAKGSSSSESGNPNLKTPTPTSKGAEGSGSSERGNPNLKTPTPTSKGAKESSSNESERGNSNLKTPTPTSKGAKESGSKERGKSPTPTSKGAESSKRGNPNLKTPTPTSKGAKGSGSNERGKSTSKSAEGSGSNKRGKTHLKTPTLTSKGAKGSGSNERGKSPIPTSKGAEGNKRGKSPTPSSKGAEGSGTPTPSSIPSPTYSPTSSSTPTLNLSPTPGPGPMKKGTQKCNPETPPPRVLGMEKSYSEIVQTGLPQTLSDGPCIWLSPYAFLDIIIYQQPPSSSFYQQRPRKKRHRRYHISRNWMSLKLKQRGSRSHCSMIQYQSDEYHNDMSKMRRIVYFRQQGDEVTETSYLLSRYTKIQNRQKTCSIYDYCDNHNKKKRERSRRNDRDLKSFLRDDIIRK